jgi:hypothetical protein
MTTATPAIQVSSLAIATRTSGVCDVGERGICYERYTLGGRPGYSFIFEQGRSDGFSPEDVALFLTITGAICAAVADYQFTNVTRLSRDCAQGRFAAAFPSQPSASSSTSTTANGAAPVCRHHHVAMEPRSHARGSWLAHEIASEPRACKDQDSRCNHAEGCGPPLQPEEETTMLRIERYPYSRFWAVWDNQDLVAVVVYKKGRAT